MGYIAAWPRSYRGHRFPAAITREASGGSGRASDGTSTKVRRERMTSNGSAELHRK